MPIVPITRLFHPKREVRRVAFVQYPRRNRRLPQSEIRFGGVH